MSEDQERFKERELERLDKDKEDILKKKTDDDSEISRMYELIQEEDEKRIKNDKSE